MDQHSCTGSETLPEFVYQEFLPKYCTWAESTRRSEGSRLKIPCATFGDQPLAAITARSIKVWLSEQEASGMSAASQNRYLAALKSVYQAAVAYGHCQDNPAAVVRTRKEAIRPKDLLTDAELSRLLKQLPDYARRIVIAANETGMRAGEIRRLRWADVDLEARELRVVVAKNREFRVVPLTDRLWYLLTEMAEAANGRPSPTDSVFGTMDIKKGLAAAVKRAGIDKHVTLHTFRHQFATRALEAGISLVYVQAIGGWKSPIMVQRYGKTRNRALHEQMSKLNPGQRDGD